MSKRKMYIAGWGGRSCNGNWKSVRTTLVVFSFSRFSTSIFNERVVLQSIQTELCIPRLRSEPQAFLLDLPQSELWRRWRNLGALEQKNRSLKRCTSNSCHLSDINNQKSWKNSTKLNQLTLICAITKVAFPAHLVDKSDERIDVGSAHSTSDYGARRKNLQILEIQFEPWLPTSFQTSKFRVLHSVSTLTDKSL